MSNKIDINELKQLCPLPHLLHRLGLGQYAKPSCPSPFRRDQKASWGIFQYSGRWMYKDFGTGEVGDEIGLLARLYNYDPHEDFRKILKLYNDIAKARLVPTKPGLPAPYSPKIRPDGTGFGPGVDMQIQRLSKLRVISTEGLQLAQERGLLVFGNLWGFELYGAKDKTGRLIEVRRLDGLDFPAWGNIGARKSHALKGSQKNWPLGILEAKDCECLALAEGLPDFLALHQFLVEESALGRVGPVGMLSSACMIAPEALEHFKGKHVRIYPHIDRAGISAAGKWQKQLQEVGARKVDFFNFSAFPSGGGSVKDLCEFNRLTLAGSNLIERSVLP